MAMLTDTIYFQRAIQLSKTALDTGNDGFGCVIVDQEGEIIVEQTNAVADENDPTAHDALTAIKKAYRQFGREKLSQSTLYATMEPCVMCMCAAYWAGLKAVKFIVSEQELNDLFGGGLEIHSREFAARSGSEMRIEGPFPRLHDDAMVVIRAWVKKVMGE